MQVKAKIKFASKDRSQFLPVLKARVDQYFSENNIEKSANGQMVIKTIILMSAYLLPFISLFIWPVNSTYAILGIYALMGVAKAGIGMSVMHDANHNAYSKNPNVNKFIGWSLNLLGGMVYNWKLQHNVLHHTYTNITGMDDDIEEKLVLRYSPHTPVRKFHRFQFAYVFFFYSILTLYWVLGKDFIQHFKYRNNGVSRSNKKENRSNLIKTAFAKSIYLAVMFIVPCVIFDYAFLPILSGFLIMHAIAGLVLGIVFQMAHSVEETSFPMPNEKGEIENDWAIHQLNTTANFARDNKLLSWYVGGLNFQVEHHLFPTICHVHYKDIAPIVKQTAEEFNVPYLDAPTFSGAFRSHINLLRKFGYEINLDLATM